MWQQAEFPSSSLESVTSGRTYQSLDIFIQDAMDLKVRDRLPAALSWAMAGLTVFLISVGALGYLAYGREVQHFITMVRVFI